MADDFERLLYQTVVPFGKRIALRYPYDLHGVQKQIRSIMKANLVSGYLPKRLPPEAIGAGGAGGAGSSGHVARLPYLYSSSDLHRVFGKDSFFFNAFQLVYPNDARAFQPYMRDSAVLQQLPQPMKQKLLSILSGQNVVAEDPVRVQQLLQANLVDKVRKGLSEYKARPQGVILGHFPQLTRDSLVDYEEPKLRDLVDAQAAHRSVASKKSVIAAALRNMREYEMLNTLHEIFVELSGTHEDQNVFYCTRDSRLGRLVTRLKPSR